MYLFIIFDFIKVERCAPWGILTSRFYHKEFLWRNFWLRDKDIHNHGGNSDFGWDWFWMHRYIIFCWSCICCISGWIQWTFSSLLKYQYLVLWHSWNLLENFSIRPIWLSLQVGIFSCATCFDIRMLWVHLFIVALIVSFFQEIL